MSRPVSRVLFPDTVTGGGATTIHLGSPLPATSSVLPVHSGGQPSSVHCLDLLLVGFTEPVRSPGPLVVSYTALSPLPRPPWQSRRSAFCGTVPRVTPGGCWPPPCPSEPGLSSTPPRAVTRPSGRLIRVQSTSLPTGADSSRPVAGSSVSARADEPCHLDPDRGAPPCATTYGSEPGTHVGRGPPWQRVLCSR